MDKYLLVITGICLLGIYGVAQSGRPRLRRQSQHSKNIFTCPALFGPSDTNALGHDTIQPPTFSDCPPANLAETYHVPAGAQGVVVNWAEPTASDLDGFLLSPVLVRGNVSGSTFPGSVGGRRYDIVYLATDTDGLATNCHFSFKVKVGSCADIQWPNNGVRVCSDNNILGSTCTYSCSSGYQPSGPTTVTCQNFNYPHWSPTPVCEKVTCGTRPTLTHGSAECTGTDYLSTCSYSCDAGYILQGPVLVKCDATGTWSMSTNTKCIDILPPSISCLSPQTFYADRGLSTTSVTWTEPIVSDNSGATLTAIRTSGPDQGTVIAAGTSLFVKYKTTDETGNESPECAIELRVQAIYCGPPSETFLDSNLTFSCTLTNYTDGDTCSLACLLNFPLVGSKVITCERNNSGSEPSGYWTWGNGNQPTCNETSCPNLDSPRHGYFELSYVNGNPLLELKCNGSDYDVPYMKTGFTGLFACHPGFGWSPYFPKPPDCIVPKIAIGFVLDSEIHYYDGDCTQTNLSTFSAKFQEILNIATARFQTVCPSNTTCSASDPRLTCTMAGRKRRSERYEAYRQQHDIERLHSVAKRQTASFTLIVSFSINVYFDLSNLTIEQIYKYADEMQLNKSKPIIQSMVNDGSFDTPSWTIRDDSFKTSDIGDVTCGPGYQNRKGIVCKPCPAGYFLQTDECEVCPLGSYAGSASVSCTHCPDGYSTNQTGSESIENCIRYCNKGFYSPDGLEPCSPCPRGFYNPKVNGTSCVSCPLQTSNVFPGSSNNADCQVFDVQLDGTGTFIDVSNVQFQDHFTFSVWMRKLNDKTPNAALKIRTDSTDILELHITNNIRATSVLVGLNKDIGEISRNTWVHVTAAVDLQGRQVVVYYNGVQTAVTHNTQAMDISHISAILSVSSTGNTGVRISGLRIYHALATQSDVDVAITKCHQYETADLVTMGDFRTTNKQGITLVTPPTCIVTDHCRDRPCGSHTCLNSDGSFTCICNNNWSGRTCDTRPDFCEGNLCENHAPCVNGQGNYSCFCQQGYSGPFCEISPVAGRWSPWSEWTECTVTCNSGTRERTRACTSPKPGAFGQNCTGVSKQTQRCNTSPCPVCPTSDLETREDIKCKPDVTSGLSCSVDCHTGYTLPKELLHHTFRCGLATGYQWLPGPNLPICLTPLGPQVMTLTSRIAYTPAVSNTNEHKFLDGLEASMAQSDCRVNGLCDTYIKAVYGSSENSFTAVDMSFKATLSDGKQVDYRQYLLNGTVSAGLRELMDTSVMMEATATWINSSASSVFDVTLDSSTYTAQVSEPYGTVTCDTGHMPSKCFCGACPAGTYLNGSTCRFCDKGSYQPEEGQTQCLSCPPGYTTMTTGSATLSHCTVSGSPATTEITKSKQEDNTNVNTGISVGASIGGFVLITAIVVCLVCRHRRRQRKPPQSEAYGYLTPASTGTSQSIGMEPNCGQSDDPAYERIDDTKLDKSHLIVNKSSDTVQGDSKHNHNNKEKGVSNKTHGRNRGPCGNRDQQERDVNRNIKSHSTEQNPPDVSLGNKSTEYIGIQNSSDALPEEKGATHMDLKNSSDACPEDKGTGCVNIKNSSDVLPEEKGDTYMEIKNSSDACPEDKGTGCVNIKNSSDVLPEEKGDTYMEIKNSSDACPEKDKTVEYTKLKKSSDAFAEEKDHTYMGLKKTSDTDIKKVFGEKPNEYICMDHKKSPSVNENDSGYPSMGKKKSLGVCLNDKVSKKNETSETCLVNETTYTDQTHRKPLIDTDSLDKGQGNGNHNDQVSTMHKVRGKKYSEASPVVNAPDYVDMQNPNINEIQKSEENCTPTDVSGTSVTDYSDGHARPFSKPVASPGVSALPSKENKSQNIPNPSSHNVDSGYLTTPVMRGDKKS